MVDNVVVSNIKVDLSSRQAKTDMVKLAIVYFGVPLRCPIESEEVFCYRGQKLLTLTESTKKVLQMFAFGSKDATLKLLIQHDKGKSCFETITRIVKD